MSVVSGERRVRHEAEWAQIRLALAGDKDTCIRDGRAASSLPQERKRLLDQLGRVQEKLVWP